MNVGIYCNLFPVEIEDKSLNLAVIDRREYPTLRQLREELESCRVYALEDKVYGFGEDLSELLKRGFEEIQLSIYEKPKLTCRLIKEGFIDALTQKGYVVEWDRIKPRAYDIKNPISVSIPGVNVFEGCEFRVIYLKDLLTRSLCYGISLDLRYRLELNGEPASYGKIWSYVARNYNIELAKDVIREIRVHTGDLTPSGKRNAEAAKFRFEKILKIVDRVNKFRLPTGHKVELAKTPVRVILEV